MTKYYYLGKEDGQAKMLPCDGSEGNVDKYVLEDDVEKPSQAAVEQERENCAQDIEIASLGEIGTELITCFNHEKSGCGAILADMIRNRGPHRDFRGLAKKLGYILTQCYENRFEEDKLYIILNRPTTKEAVREFREVSK